MKWQKLVVLIVLFTAIGALFIRQNKKQEVFEASSLAQGKYCLAIRGNGELEPAHWGAAARVIEQWGLPSAMAGGSSGSITMFLLNAVAQNPFVNDPTIDSAEKNRRAALIVKSFKGFFIELKNTKFSQDFFKLYGDFNKLKAGDITTSMKATLAAKSFAGAQTILSAGLRDGLFSVISTGPFVKALNERDEKRAQFYLQQLQEGIDLFGKFDAMKDSNLFFRQGLINFPNAANSFGRWASFYALPTKNKETVGAWQNFIKECSAASENKSWVELITAKPQCADLFRRVFTRYFANEPRSRFEDREIGSPIPVFPSTAVIVGSAAQQVEQAFLDYDKQLDPKFGDKFRIKNPEEILFGYWGDTNDLKRVRSGLDPMDEKSRRFYPLGKTTWKQVLSLSPAEPGLSALVPFEANGEKIYSAGGWSDLHPMNVLKASGCEHVVFLTRQGGESLFAQGVANRLMNLKRPISKMTAKLNDAGDPKADVNDTWSKLFNMANPKSSVNTALSLASAVACTNWNAFDVKTQLNELVEESYRSSYWIPEDKKNQVKLSPVLKEFKTGCQPL